MRTRTALNALTVLEGLLYLHQQRLIYRSAIGLWLLLPSVIATSLDTQYPAHAVQSELVFVLGHEYVLHPDSLAKYVATFFKLSRSSLTL